MSEIIKINTATGQFGVVLENTSKTIQEFFEFEKNKPSDINEHLEALKNYASECDHITEMGVRNVVSTWAFLSGKPKKYVGIDILPCPIETAERLAKEEGIDFQFIQADTIHPDFTIEETDLLFIDTWHIYRQLSKELEMHSSKARKYIIMHDTTSFAIEDEGDWDEYSKLVGEKSGKQGLWLAIEEFLESNPEWILKERFTHNNGVTVLARK